MKSKLVKYPFEEKKYRWDTQEMGKTFEYSWDKSVDNNYDTITPYIETEPFDGATIDTVEYGLLGNRDTPSYTTTVNSYYAPFRLEYGPYQSPMTISVTSIDSNITWHNLITIKSSNRASWGLTQDEYDYLLNNDIGTDRTINYLLNKSGNKLYGLINSIRYTLDGINDATPTQCMFNIVRDINTGLIISFSFDEHAFAGTIQLPKVFICDPTSNSLNIDRGTVMGPYTKSYDDFKQVMAPTFFYSHYNTILKYWPDMVPHLQRKKVGYYVINTNPVTPSAPPYYGDIYYVCGETYDPYGLTNGGNTIVNYPVLLDGTWSKIHIADFTYNTSSIHTGSIDPLSPLITNLDIYHWDVSQSEFNNMFFGEELIDDYADCYFMRYWYDDGSNHTLNYWIPMKLESTEENHYYLTINKISNEYSYIFPAFQYALNPEDPPHLPINITLTSINNIPNNTPYLIRVSDLSVSGDYLRVYPIDIVNPQYVLKPNILLIGDKTDNVIAIPSDNTTVFKYSIGDPVDREHINPKSLQINAPCEYDEQGNVISRTWLTYNSYTSSQWLNDYHFKGNNWNYLSSPWAYSGYMNRYGEHKMVPIGFELCPAGTYINVFTLDTITDIDAEDTLGNTYNTDSNTYYDNIGNLYVFDEIVKSNDRHAHPDNGTEGGWHYLLRPQDTKFISYDINQEEDELVNVELYADRYKYSHNLTEFCDRSYEGTICGSTSSTGEDTIPDGTYRTYKGLYLGESIPFLGITETVIPPSDILGVPQYDKQVNTSDTLKYGTVASGSLTFTLNKPIAEAISHNGELYILYYDFFHNNNYKRIGFMRVDGVEAIDEYSSRITAHDEVYKLNKYVDDFLESYAGPTTLDGFYRELLDYCGCWYDTHKAPILNGSFELDNVYHAIKTTGIEVAHYIATIAPGFIEANEDGDLELNQYRDNSFQLDISNMTNLSYSPYSSDMLNKVRIVANNAILGEDSGEGQNIYFINNNPLISSLLSRTTLNELADSILNTYEGIQTYRPAEITMLYLPSITTGDMPTVITPTGDVYKVAIMAITISGEGVRLVSIGAQSYPVESENSSQFVNLINDIDSVSGDVENIERATDLLGQTVAETVSDVNALDGRVAATESGLVATNSSLAATASTLSTVVSTISGYSVQTSNNLTSITLNSTTASQIVNKAYVEDNTSVSSSNNLGTVSLFGETLSNIALKGYVDSRVGTNVVLKIGSLYWNDLTSSATLNVLYFGDMNMTKGIFVPTGGTLGAKYHMFCFDSSALMGLGEVSTSASHWTLIGSDWSFTEN